MIEEMPTRLYSVVLRRYQYYRAEVEATRCSEAEKWAKQMMIFDSEDENEYGEWECVQASIIKDKVDQP